MGSKVHYSGTVLADNPLFYWRLAEPVTGANFPFKAFDQTGNNNTGSYINLSGTLNFNQKAVTPCQTDPPQTDASISIAGGTSGSVKMICHQFAIGTGSDPSFSVEWWVKPKNNSLANNMTICGNPSITGSQIGSSYFSFRLNTDSSANVGINQGDQFTIPSGTIPVNACSHCVFTFTSGGIGTFYKNGQIVAGPQVMSRPVAAWTEFVLGSPNAGNANVFGQWDEVAVYRYALSASQVQNHWQAAFSTYRQQVWADNPKLYWRLGEASGSNPNFADSSDNGRTGSFFGGPANFTFASPGLIFNDTDAALSGNATTYQGHVQFTGSSMEIGQGGTSNPFSVEWWTNPGQVAGGSGNTIGRGLGQFTAGISGTNGEAFCGISVTDLYTPPQLGPGFYTVGQKSHHVFTYDGTVGRVYKNGFLVARPRSMVAPATWGAVDPFKVGVSGAWLGTFDEVAVYGYALPSQRVYEHYSQGINLSGSGLAAPTITAVSATLALNTGGDFLVVTGSNFQIGAAVLVRSGTATLSGNFAAVDLTGTNPSFISFNFPNVSGSTAGLVGIGTGSYDIIVINPDSSVATASLAVTVVTGARYESVIVADRPVLYWQLRDASGSLFTADRSNRQNTGTIGNSNPFLVYHTTSLVADAGYNDFSFAETNINAPVPFISIGAPNKFPASYPVQPAVGIGGVAGAPSFSVEFWIRFISGSTPLEGNGNGGTPRLGFNSPGFLLNVNNAANGTTTVATDTPSAITASSFLQLRNVTHHVCYTFSSSVGSTTGNGRLYRDGQLIAQATQNVPTIWQAFQFLGPVSGAFDEIAVYDYPLNSTQVAIHYETGYLYPAEDLGQNALQEAAIQQRVGQTLGVTSFLETPIIARPFQDLIKTVIAEGAIASFPSDDIVLPWPSPFQMIEGAGGLDIFKNSQLLFFGSGTQASSGGGSTADTTPPVLSNFSPAFGNAIASTQPISFDITDNSGFLKLTVLLASFAGLVGTEVIYDGTNFNPGLYTNSNNVVTPITGGLHFKLLRDGGWPGAITLLPLVVDPAGNENT